MPVRKGSTVASGLCRRMGAFGVALKNKELHQSFCRDCGSSVLTRTYGIILCMQCRPRAHAAIKRRQRAAKALALYMLVWCAEMGVDAATGLVNTAS